MLSAIAARKVRLALGTSSPQVAERETTKPPSSGLISDKIQRDRSKAGTKRKHDGSPTPPVNLSKRNKDKTTQPPADNLTKRYFEEHVAVGHTVTENDDRLDSGESPVSTDEDDMRIGGVATHLDIPAVPSAAIEHNTARRWSPSIPMRDSSDEGSDAEGAPPSPERSIPTRTDLQTQPHQSCDISTFQPVLGQNTFRLSSEDVSHLRLTSPWSGSADDVITMIVLGYGDVLALLGTYAFIVVHGSVSISGVTIRACKDAHRVFAPRSSPIPVIRCISEGSGTEPSCSFLPSRFASLGGHQGAVVVLQSLRTDIEGLGVICSTFDHMFEIPQTGQGEVELLPTTQLIKHESKDIQPFVLPRTWEDALLSISSSKHSTSTKPLVCLVKGPKKTGKSTFARTLLNRLCLQYRRVAFLDCDPGQSEFTPAGMVALNIVESPMFGPPFSHPSIPSSAHYIGATSPRSSPSHYLAAVQALVQFYRLDVETPADVLESHPEDLRIPDVIPLVVNTMGWNKGLGADLAVRIEEIAEPTDIFEIQSPDQSWPVPYIPPLRVQAGEIPPQNGSIRLHSLKPVSSATQTVNSPADFRNLSILSYFHAVFPFDKAVDLRQISAVSWNTAIPLCSHPPYEVDWAMAIEKVILVGAGMEDVVPSEIERVLNGALVGLVNCEPGTLDEDMNIQDQARTPSARCRIPYTQAMSPPSPSTSVCSGLALVRAISPTSSHMHMITPLPPHLFVSSRVLVKGELELPIWGLLDFRNESRDAGGVDLENAPFLRWGKKGGIGTERRRVRRNLMRKGQM